jgi:hypothetical protein
MKLWLYIFKLIIIYDINNINIINIYFLKNNFPVINIIKKNLLNNWQKILLYKEYSVYWGIDLDLSIKSYCCFKEHIFIIIMII